jgi:transposase
MQRLELNSANEIREMILSYFNKNDEAKFIHRLHAILLKIENQDTTCNNIAGMFGQSPRSVSNWIKKVNQAGSIEVLRDSKRTGRKEKLSKNEVEDIKQVLQKDPELSGVTTNIWDGKSLSFYIQKTYSISLGVRQCQRLFHKMGFSLKRARPTVCKSDPVKKEASKKNLKRN